MIHGVLEKARLYFAGGVLVVVPIIITYVVLKMLFETVDGILGPLVERLLGYSVPGLGIAVTLAIILVVGALARSFLGARAVAYGDRLLGRVPLIRPIYSAARQLLSAFTAPQEQSYKQVGMIRLTPNGPLAVCFVMKRFFVERKGCNEEFASVFIPSTPAPVTGFTVLVPLKDVTVVEMSVEEALRFFVSGGSAAPEGLQLP